MRRTFDRVELHTNTMINIDTHLMLVNPKFKKMMNHIKMNDEENMKKEKEELINDLMPKKCDNDQFKKNVLNLLNYLFKIEEWKPYLNCFDTDGQIVYLFERIIKLDTFSSSSMILSVMSVFIFSCCFA